ncbi:MAG: nitroreductase family deazaflavin-dependent oxidoreductase [Dehalococcoidia bacterium]|nr:nitroreductase family deazaflavin-dependent oxidoreductase [Dehalococcoidia bacterium]
MTNWNDRNKAIIEEFRGHSGKAGSFPGGPLLLLTTMGAKSGKSFTTPLMYLQDGKRVVVIASKGGAPGNPDWYHNLVANPTVTVELGAEMFEANAVVMTGHERDDLYSRQAKRYPFFAEYEKQTKRKIPVIALERKG